MDEKLGKQGISAPNGSECNPGSCELVSGAEYARRRGVSRTAVYKAMRWRIAEAVQPDRRIDVAEADRLWIANTDPTRGGNGRGAGPRVTEEEARAIFDAWKNGGPIPPLHVSRLVLLHYRAESLRLDIGLKTGELMWVADAERDGFKVGRAARDAMLAIPDRLAAEVAGMDDAEKIKARLTAEVIAALGPIMDLAEGRGFS